MAGTAPGALDSPGDLAGLDWLPATAPGTVAGALMAAGRNVVDLDAKDWWYRTSFEADAPVPGESVVLRLDGLATLADVFLNGRSILSSTSMFRRHAVDVGALLRDTNELTIRFRALAPELARSRRPRPRWRTRLVAENNLRWFRTMLLGRLPGFAPGPPAIGPWRSIVLERRRALVVDALRVRSALEGTDGVVHVRVEVQSLGDWVLGGASVAVDGPNGHAETALTIEPVDGGVRASGAVRMPEAQRWWPHTHGSPALHRVSIVLGDGPDRIVIDGGHVGFRSLRPGAGPGHDIERDGLFVHVNDLPVFARGALWTPLDLVTLAEDAGALRGALEDMCAAGMNMVRLPAFGPDACDAFHDLCDELGILVWQDLQFMSLDYPFEDADFGAEAHAEVAALVERLAGRPSTTVLCGNSEVQQQVAMMALDLALTKIPFYDDVVPAIAGDAALDAIYVPSAPFGGDLPMRPDRGVTGYYGVGGYGRPISDARTSGIRFAAECLAFANVPDEEALASLVPVPPYEAFVHNPHWKAGVARDAGMGWDFDDIRDLYLEALFGIDSVALRRADHDRYLELSRAATGEVMAQVFGEWRRSASPCGGGLVLWLRDVAAGAGWGLLDHRGVPKVAWHHLRRALAPVAVWLVDEGIGGVIAHVANDRDQPLTARLRIACYADQETPAADAVVPLALPAHGNTQVDIEAAIGHFIDAAWAYRFGPPAQDTIVASLETDDEDGFELRSQAFHFPAGRPLKQEPASRLGLTASAAVAPDGRVRLAISTTRLVYGLRIHATGYRASDNAFSVEPHFGRTVELVPISSGTAFTGAGLTALNLIGRVPVMADPGPPA